MKLLQLFFTAFTAAILSTACTIEQEITFNEKMGGQSVLKLDMKEYLDMMSIMGGEEFNFNELTDSLKLSMGEFTDQYNSQEGISNASSYFDDESGSMIISFDFEKFENLSTLDANSEALGLGSPQYILGKSSFTYKLGKTSEDMNSEEIALMGDMFKFNIKFNFPEKIKKLSNKAYTLTEDGKGIVLEATLPQIMDHKGKFDVTVNW